MMAFTRFIALGDSMTEGMCDEIVDGNYRGWADRVADTISKENPNFSYVNLTPLMQFFYYSHPYQMLLLFLFSFQEVW